MNHLWIAHDRAHIQRATFQLTDNERTLAPGLRQHVVTQSKFSIHSLQARVLFSKALVLKHSHAGCTL